MATKSMAYDHPEYVIRRNFSGVNTAGANGSSASFVAFQNTKLHAVSFKVLTAGTSAGAGNAAIIRSVSGTTTTNYTTVALGTNTAGYTTRVELPSTATMLPFDNFNFVNGTDATGRFFFALEYSALPGAEVSE